MDDPRITPDLVRKAVIAKGHHAAREGIGRTMRRALEAVVDDLIARNPCPCQRRPFVDWHELYEDEVDLDHAHRNATPERTP